jgi:hypothetical protein
MPTYLVHITQTVSAVLRIEAESPEEALEDFENHDDMPGRICHQAFGDARVDESGEWEPQSVTTPDDVQVWPVDSRIETVRVEVPAMILAGRRSAEEADAVIQRWAGMYADSHDYQTWVRVDEDGHVTAVDFSRRITAENG